MKRTLFKRSVLFLRNQNKNKHEVIYLYADSSLLYIFSSCKGDSSNSAPFDGVFVTESGIKFELKEDSTTLILFDDTLNYEGVWSIHHTNESEYANIEFAGKPDYYYLKDKKIYRSKREMESDWMGTKIQYLN